MGPVGTVGVAAMDTEHEECVVALNRLGRLRTSKSLVIAIRVLQDHFSHEEAMLDTHVFKPSLDCSTDASTPATPTPSKSGMCFSAASDMRRTHFADHARFLAKMRSEIAGLSPPESESGENDSSSDSEGWQSDNTNNGGTSLGGALVSSRFIKGLMQEFAKHAGTYDQYGDAMLAAATRTEQA